ncbi:hypothetical protein GGU11DRAFT_845060 [Lentinula aff. detonsa]|nr:hypothetical protein GGU11DRAFT_845060 [Lentinula aff. detonsa]
MSVSIPGAGFNDNDTAPAVHNEEVHLDVVQSPSTQASSESPNPSNPGSPSASEAESRNKNSCPKSIDLATAIANFRPTPKEIINGIAPHVFDERRTRSRRRRSLSRRGSIGRGRPSSASYDFYHPGLAGIHGSAGYQTHSGLSRRSSRTFDGSIPRPATAPSYSASSMKFGTSPLRVSAVITVEDIDTLLGAECERKQIDDAEISDSGLPQVSYTLPTLGSHEGPKHRMSRFDLTLGKRKTTSDESTSPSSSDDGNKQAPIRKSKWPSIRIDIQVLRSIGFKIRTSKRSSP